MRPLRVFLCHSSNDKPTVRELYQKLRAEAWIQPWLDEEELYPGQDWNMEIEKAVEAADAIIVCLTKNSINKEGYVQRELRTVLDFADYKPEGTLYIIPVRLEECEPPRRLRAWQYADYFEGQRERAFQRLLVSLKRRADGLGLMAEEVERKQQIEEQAKPEVKEKTSEPEIKKPEERVVSARVIEKLKEEPKKEIPAKPFTKLLDPSSLSPKKTSHSQGGKQSVRKSEPNNNLRWIGIGGVILLVLVLGGFGLNYLINNLPVASSTPTPTPLVTAIVLPSGHVPPDAQGNTKPNEAEIPEHLRPMAQSLANMPVPTAAPDQAVRIQIPSINVDAPIVQGDGWEQLKKGVGQYVGSPDPGQVGNIVLSAHNDVYGELFRYLDRLVPNDQVIIYTEQKQYVYIVDRTVLVEPTAVEVMMSSGNPTVTLISCYPYLVDTQRIVVFARLQN